MEQDEQYVATVSPVREVMVRGRADFDYWRRRLAGEGLVPLAEEGAARVTVVAADTRFKGLRFQELSFSIEVEDAAGHGETAAYLIQAYNGRRFFAWVERRVFRTPYDHASVEVRVERPVSMRLSRRGHTLFAARMSGARAPLRQGVETWKGRVHLPTASRREPPARRCFHGFIQGETTAYAFEETDELTFASGVEGQALAPLVESGFRGVEWRIREAGTHSKGKTRRWRD